MAADRVVQPDHAFVDECMTSVAVMILVIDWILISESGATGTLLRVLTTLNLTFGDLTTARHPVLDGQPVQVLTQAVENRIGVELVTSSSSLRLGT